MNQFFKYVVALSCVVSLSGCAAQPCSVVVPSNEPSGISVSGSGEVEGEPDVAVATLGVEVRSSSAKDATDQLALQMTQVVDALKSAGVTPSDIQTAQLSIYMEHVPYAVEMSRDGGGSEGAVKEGGGKPAPQHRATNTVTVKIRDLDRASTIITAALSAGANAVHGLQFDIEDKGALIEQARKKSMDEARASAEALAQLAGVKLGSVRQISENASYSHPMMANVRAESMDASAKMMPVERGTMTVSHNVQVTYEITSEK